MDTEQFRIYQEQTFDSFCKTVIRNESAQVHRELASRAKHETQFSALPGSEVPLLATEDTYHPYRKTYYVRGHSINIYDPDLGESLQYLTPQHRDVLLLSYFLEYNDIQIGKVLGISNYAVRIRKAAGLRLLRKMMERFDNG